MRRRAHVGGRESGFTLVEVLVAFFIAALTLTIALRVLGAGAGWARRGPAAALRVDEMSSVMEGLVAGAGPGSGAREGVLADGQPWRAQITEVTGLVVPKGAPGHLVRVDLFAGRAGAPALSTLAVVPLRPRS